MCDEVRRCPGLFVYLNSSVTSPDYISTLTVSVTADRIGNIILINY